MNIYETQILNCNFIIRDDDCVVLIVNLIRVSKKDKTFLSVHSAR